MDLSGTRCYLGGFSHDTCTCVAAAYTSGSMANAVTLSGARAAVVLTKLLYTVYVEAYATGLETCITHLRVHSLNCCFLFAVCAVAPSFTLSNQAVHKDRHTLVALKHIRLK